MYARLMAVSAALLTLSACGGGESTPQASSTPAVPAAAPAADSGAAPAVTGSLPEGVTQAMVDSGKALFHGAGLCLTCHGTNGVGVQSLGPNLGDAEWLHSDGSYQAIVKQIHAGVPANESKSGTVMPPMGGATQLTEDQINAIAGYVYSLRNK